MRCASGKDAAEDVLENHPQLKEKLGGSADQLKQLGEQIGPKAKKVGSISTCVVSLCFRS